MNSGPTAFQHLGGWSNEETKDLYVRKIEIYIISRTQEGTKVRDAQDGDQA